MIGYKVSNRQDTFEQSGSDRLASVSIPYRESVQSHNGLAESHDCFG